MRIQTPLTYACIVALVFAVWGMQLFFSGDAVAAGTIKGVGTMGYGAPAPASPPRSFGAPGDFERGYSGSMPNSDPWNRDADFKARNYQLRYGPQPQFATPPGVAGGALEPAPLPTLPKPPLPGDRDMPSDSPTPQ
jgi:hypothetical protein